jgi:hypothetical protein
MSFPAIAERCWKISHSDRAIPWAGRTGRRRWARPSHVGVVPVLLQVRRGRQHGVGERGHGLAEMSTTTLNATFSNARGPARRRDSPQRVDPTRNRTSSSRRPPPPGSRGVPARSSGKQPAPRHFDLRPLVLVGDRTAARKQPGCRPMPRAPRSPARRTATRTAPRSGRPGRQLWTAAAVAASRCPPGSPRPAPPPPAPGGAPQPASPGRLLQAFDHGPFLPGRQSRCSATSHSRVRRGWTT